MPSVKVFGSHRLYILGDTGTQGTSEKIRRSCENLVTHPTEPQAEPMKQLGLTDAGLVKPSKKTRKESFLPRDERDPPRQRLLARSRRIIEGVQQPSIAQCRWRGSRYPPTAALFPSRPCHGRGAVRGTFTSLGAVTPRRTWEPEDLQDLDHNVVTDNNLLAGVA